MIKKSKIDPSDLCQLLEYDPLTGSLHWLPRENVHKSWNTKYANKPAFTADNGEGYRCGAVMSVSLKAHSVAWAIYYGEWCSGQIDHIDGNKSNNAISNLREVTHSQNQQNKWINKNNTSGFKGVSWNNQHMKWGASIGVSGKMKNLGYFETKEEAAIARDEGAKKYHGKFCVLNVERA